MHETRKISVTIPQGLNSEAGSHFIQVTPDRTAPCNSYEITNNSSPSLRKKKKDSTCNEVSFQRKKKGARTCKLVHNDWKWQIDILLLTKSNNGLGRREHKPFLPCRRLGSITKGKKHALLHSTCTAGSVIESILFESVTVT